MPPLVATQITQHTLWQALTGHLPPAALPPRTIARAGTDSRDMAYGDLFIALQGENTDGHRFIADALQRGAQAVICEARGEEQARQRDAVVIDCRVGMRDAAALNATPDERPLVYIVDNSEAGLQAVGGFQRLHRSSPNLSVIGITGSIGKTSTKELTYAVVRQRYATLCSQGNLNSVQGLPLTLLALTPHHERAVLEMGMTALGEIRTMCALARPRIGVVTNVGPVHLSRLGSMENITRAKSELVEALPSASDGGVAILNWDDERVRGMAALTDARIFRYGLTPEADLWAGDISSAGMEGIRFVFHARDPQSGRVESLRVRVPLLGRHSVHTALRAAAVGLVEGLGWDEIVAGLQSMPAQIRLVAIPGIAGSTIIDDTYNASPASMIAALNLLHDLEPEQGGRRIAVLGDMRELGEQTEEGHQMVGRRAADVADVLVTVGDLGRLLGDEAELAGLPADRHLHAGSAQDAVTLLHDLIRAGDLVLVKGSRALGMDRIVPAISRDEQGAVAAH